MELKDIQRIVQAKNKQKMRQGPREPPEAAGET
jgi:hypothetical protein